MAEVYLIKNTVNDMVYVGSTTISVYRRFIEHKSDARTGKYESKFMSALRELGEDNFSIGILEVCEDADVWERENHWITKFDSCENGYNGNHQNTTVLVYSVDGYLIDEVPSSREFARNYNYDIKTAWLCLTGKQHRVGAYTLFRKSSFTTEQLQERLLSINSSNKVNDNRKFGVYKDDELIGEFASKIACAKELGLTSQHIGPVLNGKAKSHKGYTFKYLD
jgi:group I intron endonuclease